MSSSLRLERRELHDRREVRFSGEDLHQRLKEKIAEVETDRRERRRRHADQREPVTTGGGRT